MVIMTVQNCILGNLDHLNHVFKCLAFKHSDLGVYFSYCGFRLGSHHLHLEQSQSNEALPNNNNKVE